MTFNAANVTNKRVAVVAAGVISPLGLGLAETLESLRTARDCVGPVTRFDVQACRCQTAAQVRDEGLQPITNGSRARRLHPASNMMIRALHEALDENQNFHPDLAVIGTTSGGMSFGEQYYRALSTRAPLQRAPRWIANYSPQKPAVDALEAFGLECPCQIIANACASGTNAIGHAFHCIRSGKYRRVLAGGYDALCELVFVGFDSLQAATPDKCRPFDADRTGMVLGEGAAVLALEEWNSAQDRGANILAEITGYGISTDNHHLTQPNPSGIGPRDAMEQALRTAGIDESMVDYINAHGTATKFNDSAEAKAIRELFPSGPPVSSTKSMMGHSLGAAGAIEAVVCLLAIQHSFLPPNINFTRAGEDVDLDIVANQPRSSAVRTAVSNSFGFGGTNASIVLQTARS
ncbi:MAG TPA: beta-ketoacyl-[acyl-carrier-protein] synthase family protein [Chthoniobacterales bacterium]|nr:beta-ketoacyl-[acyl-carrier-protein] synthase family protein [Chthoniobacterales bacterium]